MAVLRLHRPWLIAIWPGMGHVALNAGFYLLSKLNMGMLAEFEANDLFDIDQIEVKNGVIEPVRRPRNRLFVWTDPHQKHDLIIFLGEAQPPIGKFAFCRQLIDHVRSMGVERVFTFAAMATQMRPDARSRVFAAATDREGVEELKRLELEPLEDGNIGGLNGVLLGAAADAKLRGACLLGEMPHMFAQFPFPKASLGILEAFAVLADLELDLTELAEQAKNMDVQFANLVARVEREYRRQQGEEEGYEASEEGEDATPEATANEPKTADPATVQKVEQLFDQAAADRSKAFELKQELDRLGLFKEYENRFLDLFKKAE